MTWYFEEALPPGGTWSPRTAAEEPRVRKADGGRRRIRAVQEVPAYFRNLTLDQLFETLSPDGRFAAQHRREVQ